MNEYWNFHKKFLALNSNTLLYDFRCIMFFNWSVLLLLFNFFFLLLFHLLAKDSSSIKKIDTCIYSRKNPQKISENLLLCIRYGKTTKKLYKWVCLWFKCIIIDYCAVHDFFWVSSDLFCWNCCQLARIGSDSRYLQFTFPFV